MKIEGIEQLRARLRRIPEAVRDEVRREMESRADDLVAAIKAAAPKDFGALTASIGWTWGDAPAGSFVIAQSSKGNSYAAMRITIFAGNEQTVVTTKSGARFQNAFLQEFGTKEMPANPFFFPVWRVHKRRIRGGITRAVKRGIQKG